MKSDSINAVFISIVLLLGLWNLSIFYIPALILIGITIFIAIRNNQLIIPISVTPLSFFLLLSYEIIIVQTSKYRPNSIIFLRDFLFILCIIFLINKLLKNRKFQIYGAVFISIIAGLLALFNIPVFFFRYYESSIHGFEDFSQFRFLYRPLGFLSNEWITIMLCFLPFSFISLLLFWKKTIYRYLFLCIICLLIFNIFISFSRGGILSFLLFIVTLNILFFFNHLVSIKKLLLFNAILFFSIILFALRFSDSIQSSIHQTYSHQRSTDSRVKQWREIIHMDDNIPFFGIGSKNYALLGHTTQQIDLEYSFTGRVNNTYIQLLLEKGWIGALLWLWIIGLFSFHLCLQIRSGKTKLDKIIDCILLSAIFAILFREISFSSLFHNSGILLLFFILLIFNYKEAKKTRIIKQPILTGLLILFLFITLCFCFFKKSDNALLYATKGLECERTLNNKIPYNALHEYYNLPISTKQDTITKAIEYYKKSHQLSPSDAMFQHNIGWLYWMNHQSDSALSYFSQAVKLEPNVALYHISKGLITESRNTTKAFEAYKQAVLLSPDITDSSFFQDLKKRNPRKTEELLKEASDVLQQILSVRYTSIIEAKAGKIMLSLGKTESAYKMLKHVTEIHPNLNRPWYYQGFIEQTRGNFSNMQIFYKKSLFLSPSDHLLLYAFAHYYEKIGDKSKSDSYHKAANRAWKNKYSIHSSQCRRMYYKNTEKDNVIPKGLLDYVTPKFQIQTYDKN